MFIYTGRFQPFHNGHLWVIDYLREHFPDSVICIAIIKDFPFREIKDDFDRRVDVELLKNECSFNAEIALSLINRIIKNREYRNVVTTLMPRASAESWDTILKMFDCDRTWIFTHDENQVDEWEELKIDFYHSQGEAIKLVPITKNINGTDIRELLINRKYSDLCSLVPLEILDYYLSNMSPYKS